MLNEQENQNMGTSSEIKQENVKKTVFKGFVKTLSAAILGSGITLATVSQLGYFNDRSTDETEYSAATEKVEQDEPAITAKPVSSSASLADVIEEASEAIVGITNIQEQQQYNRFGNRQGSGQEGTEVESGTGSGVIYKVSDGAAYIVTNHHVIENASTIEVTLSDGKVVNAERVGSDELTDIAVLKITGTFDITPLAFGDSSVLRAGETVIAIGNPLGLDLSNTVTQGIVSAVDRSIEVSTSSGVWDMEVIQTDAAINPGNSGGALINTSGELVGINSMKIAEDDVEGLGFAIPSNEAKTIIEQLTENGQIVRPYLGISMINVADISQFYLQNMPSDVTDGVVIAELDANGAAAQAGLQQDDIIVSINNQKIPNANELRKYLYTELSVGDKVTIQFYRQGELMEVSATLSSNQQ